MNAPSNSSCSALYRLRAVREQAVVELMCGCFRSGSIHQCCLLLEQVGRQWDQRGHMFSSQWAARGEVVPPSSSQSECFTGQRGQLGPVEAAGNKRKERSRDCQCHCGNLQKNKKQKASIADCTEELRWIINESCIQAWPGIDPAFFVNLHLWTLEFVELLADGSLKRRHERNGALAGMAFTVYREAQGKERGRSKPCIFAEFSVHISQNFIVCF